jgi:protein-L-isoaspartate(D-aspartate) O-methyltransferase
MLWMSWLVALTALSCRPAPERDDADRGREREQMVAQQIASRGVRDEQTLAAMGHGQTISQPYIVAFMTEALHLDGDETVLEVGTGSGYQAAVLAEIVSRVYSIEIVAPLAEEAGDRLRDLGYSNVEVRAGDGYQGWPEAAPFDAIIVTAAAPRIPEPLREQLRDGGRLVLPVGDEWQELVVVTRRGDRFEEKRVLPVRFVPMTGEVRH